MADAEKNTPYLKPLTTFGTENTQDPLVTSEGWRVLQDTGIKEGIVALGYEDASEGRGNHRVRQYVKYHLWSASSGLVTCPSAMTDGAARLLGFHLNDEHGEIFAEARRRLISREIGTAWTSGQWMTERKGGSDVRGTETIATKVVGPDDTDGVDAEGLPLGPWKINGFKWFSSATDANMTILLAKTGMDGQISAFYAPLRRRVPKDGAEGETQLNGVRIQRLKNKLGTKPLPTAELELKGMRGYLLGKEGQGVKEISTVLNITRMHNIISAVGAWGRGLAISRAFARVRTSSGKLLCDIPAHVRGLAQEHVKYWAHMHLAYFTAALLGRSEGYSAKDDSTTAASLMLPDNLEDVKALYRILTPLGKAQTALAAISGLRACMESLGGVGYLENEDAELNIARLYRDTNVLAIWEGTTDIMADDLVRAIKGPGGPQALRTLDAWLRNAIDRGSRAGFTEEGRILKSLLEELLSDFRLKDKDELRWKGRDYLRELDFLVCSCLLLLDATRDDSATVKEIVKRWISSGRSTSGTWKEDAVWDRRIVYGDSIPHAKL